MEPAARTLRVSLRRVVALALAGLSLGLALASPAWLDRLLPLQAVVLAELLPGFDIQSVSMDRSTRQLRLAVEATTNRYLVTGAGHAAVPPGVAFEAYTPARQTQRLATLLCAALAWVLWSRARLSGASWAVLAVAAPLVLVTSSAVVLAGEIWGVAGEVSAMALGREGGRSAATLLELASGFLLHGGDLLLGLLPPILMVLLAHGWYEQDGP
jgi:hypothetical protein